MKCGDGDFAYTEASSSVSLAKGADLAQALGTVAKAMGLNASRAIARVQQGDIPVGARTYSRGFAANGKSSVVMTKMLSRAGLSWTSQNGELVVLSPAEVQPGEAILLTYNTGLLDSPEPNDVKEEKGKPKQKDPPTTSVKSLLQGAAIPGAALDVRGEFVKGVFRVQSVKQTGDTHGTDWFSSMEAVTR